MLFSYSGCGGIILEQTSDFLNRITSSDDDIEMSFESNLNVLVIVAHPDDETLWTGGLMLMCRNWQWQVISLCRGSDTDRRPRFFKALKLYDAKGRIADLDDGPKQSPLDPRTVESAILTAVGDHGFDVVITHSPVGEYTRHRRHEETSLAVTALWHCRDLRAKELWYFAYSDNQRTHLPKAIENAHLSITLPSEIRRRKQDIVGSVYGFSPDTWEYQTTPPVEAFWRFRSRSDAKLWQTRLSNTETHKQS
jgi:LmbE family N-acetylglucosaminyl deacetylase